MNGDSSAADPDEKDYRSSEDGMVRAIRNTQRLAEEVMNATGCAVSDVVGIPYTVKTLSIGTPRLLTYLS